MYLYEYDARSRILKVVTLAAGLGLCLREVTHLNQSEWLKSEGRQLCGIIKRARLSCINECIIYLTHKGCHIKEHQSSHSLHSSYVTI